MATEVDGSNPLVRSRTSAAEELDEFPSAPTRRSLRRVLPGASLAVDGRPVAPVEVAVGAVGRGRGLLGRDVIHGALVLWPTSSVHTFAMVQPIDVAFCDRRWRVVAVRRLPPRRVSRPRPSARLVVEAAATAFDAWGLRPGSHLAIVPGPDPDHAVASSGRRRGG